MTALLYGLYPAWLMAGLCDYFCHRRTHIETTSGATESAWHILQFISLGIALMGAVLLQVSAMSFILITSMVIAHTLLGYIDVRYTDGRRHILPFEQMVHGFMEVLPLVAAALFGFLYWPIIRSVEWSLRMNRPVSIETWLFLGSYLVLGSVNNHSIAATETRMAQDATHRARCT